LAWIDQYRGKVVPAEHAVRAIKSGDRVYVHPGCATPQKLIAAMVGRAPELENVEVIHMMTLGNADYTKPEMQGHFRHNALFTGSNTREAVNEGRADYTPVFLSEVSRLFSDGTLPLDVALVHLSPPDEHGFCSFGVGVDTTKAAAHAAKTIIAEVNTEMPRSLGDSFIHVSKLHFVVETSYLPTELPRRRMGEEHVEIGKIVANLIGDGDTIQMGIGSIPDAILSFLQDRKDLGVHTEMFSDGIVELVESGVITGERKTLHPGKVVAGFTLGTKELYRFIDNNPLFEFRPSEYTNDPFIICQNDNMVAVNSGLQVDLTGQVTADSLGSTIYSGIGGQVDFIRGAARSRNGRPVIAMLSTAKDGEISRIVPRLEFGAGVVTSRADIHYVATEYGVANLHGRTRRERALALMDIAHPKFRDWLMEEAWKQHYVPKNIFFPGGKVVRGGPVDSPPGT
jgi:acetyl-CoA hydrolase